MSGVLLRLILGPVKAWIGRTDQRIVGGEPEPDTAQLVALVNTMTRLQDQRLLELETRLARLEAQLARRDP